MSGENLENKDETKEVPQRNESLDDVVDRGNAELDNKEVEEKKEKEEEQKPDPMAQILESINSLGEEVKSVNDRMSEFQDKLTPVEKNKEEESQEDDPNGPNYKPTSWKELHDKTEETVEQVIERKKKEESDAEKAKADELKAIDEEFNAQEKKLAEDNILPEVKNADDPNDPGRAFRREMYAWAAQLETLNLDKVGRNLKKMHDDGYNYDPKTGEFLRTKMNPLGGQVPIGSSSARMSSDGKPSYKDIHRMSMDEMVRRSES